MGNAPCGCEQELKAKRRAGAAERKALVLDGKRGQDLWRCPFAGHPEPRPGDPPLPPVARDALERASRVTGLPLQQLQTCPRYYAAQPVVKEICRARRWAERGELSARYGGEIPNFVFEAVDVLDDAVSDREAEDNEALRKKFDQPPPSPTAPPRGRTRTR